MLEKLKSEIKQNLVLLKQRVKEVVPRMAKSISIEILCALGCGIMGKVIASKLLLPEMGALVASALLGKWAFVGWTKARDYLRR